MSLTVNFRDYVIISLLLAFLYTGRLTSPCARVQLTYMDTKTAGKKGGEATLKKYGVEHFKKIRAIKPKKVAEKSENK